MRAPEHAREGHRGHIQPPLWRPLWQSIDGGLGGNPRGDLGRFSGRFSVKNSRKHLTHPTTRRHPRRGKASGSVRSATGRRVGQISQQQGLRARHPRMIRNSPGRSPADLESRPLCPPLPSSDMPHDCPFQPGVLPGGGPCGCLWCWPRCDRGGRQGNLKI
jgi:hypothetical protein